MCGQGSRGVGANGAEQRRVADASRACPATGTASDCVARSWEGVCRPWPLLVQALSPPSPFPFSLSLSLLVSLPLSPLPPRTLPVSWSYSRKAAMPLSSLPPNTSTLLSAVMVWAASKGSGKGKGRAKLEHGPGCSVDRAGAALLRETARDRARRPARTVHHARRPASAPALCWSGTQLHTLGPSRVHRSAPTHLRRRGSCTGKSRSRRQSPLPSCGPGATPECPSYGPSYRYHPSSRWCCWGGGGWGACSVAVRRRAGHWWGPTGGTKQAAQWDLIIQRPARSTHVQATTSPRFMRLA